MKQRILEWCRSYWQPAEPINVGLGLPRTMADGEIILLQRHRPAVKEHRSRLHCFEPLEYIVVSIYLKWHRHEVGFFRLVEGSGSATDDALLAIADLSQDCTEASSGGICVEPESLAKIWEGSDGAGCQQVLRPVEGGLAFGAPVKDRVFPD